MHSVIVLEMEKCIIILYVECTMYDGRSYKNFLLSFLFARCKAFVSCFLVYFVMVVFVLFPTLYVFAVTFSFFWVKKKKKENRGNRDGVPGIL